MSNKQKKISLDQIWQGWSNKGLQKTFGFFLASFYTKDQKHGLNIPDCHIKIYMYTASLNIF